MATTDPTLRFSTRVENYLRYRPGYPSAVIDTLMSECGLRPSSTVADIACGTGIFTKMLLEYGNHVIGVEPNREMREAAERLLGSYDRFTSVAETAEATSRLRRRLRTGSTYPKPVASSLAFSNLEAGPF